MTIRLLRSSGSGNSRRPSASSCRCSALVWLPSTIYLFSIDRIEWGIFMGLWGFLVVSTGDNIIRPYFISLGSALPLLLVYLGVLGGIIAFGFLGLFIGPTLLAVAYTIIREWTHSRTFDTIDPRGADI